MRSTELAGLAEVTVRALRHYHHVGVLPEPERGSNGYRDYTVHHLMRLLRIKRLSALGIPLDRMPAILDSRTQNTLELLDGLERDLDAEIARLDEQRALVRVLRLHEAEPDIPPELARFITEFTDVGISPTLARMDREQAILLAHLAGESGMRRLVEVYEKLSDPALRDELADLARDFEALQPGVADEQIDHVVEAYLRVIEVFSSPEIVPSQLETIDTRTLGGLLDDYQRDGFTEPQRRAFALVLDRVSREAEETTDRRS